MSTVTLSMRRTTVALLLIAMLTLVVLVALFTPEQVQGGRSGDARLSTHRTSAQGARLLYELADRLGWRVARRSQLALPDDRPGGTIHALLAPAVPLTAREAHALLQRVREGDALLYVLSDADEPLADSLRVRTGTGGELVAPAAITRGAAPCAPGNDGAVPLWSDWRAQMYQLRWTGPSPEVDAVFARVRVRNAEPPQNPELLPPAAAGFRLGRGRVVVASDPDLLRNDVLRVCRWHADLIAVRMLEFLSDDDAGGRRERLLFDEYHQGFGLHPGTTRAVVHYLSRTASGSMFLQLAAAGLLWLLAAAPRALSPRDPARVERRSPFEHVTALASAYEKVDASRTAVGLLLRGVRRRVEHASRAAGAQSDAGFLDWAQRRVPALHDDVALVRRALDADAVRRDLPAVAGALQRIESSLATLTR